MNKHKHIDLFSGIGGFALAARFIPGTYETIAHSEIDADACKIYHKHYPESKCLGDITKINWKIYNGTIDLITGGFPCQPHSTAGKKLASKDSRNLWAECRRALREIQPKYAIFENVQGLPTSEKGKFFSQILCDIHESGYDAEWYIVGAKDVGAPHRRNRIFIICYPTTSNSMRI